MLLITLFIAGLVLSLVLVSISQSFQHMYAVTAQDVRSLRQSGLFPLVVAGGPVALESPDEIALIRIDADFADSIAD